MAFRKVVLTFIQNSCYTLPSRSTSSALRILAASNELWMSYRTLYFSRGVAFITFSRSAQPSSVLSFQNIIATISISNILAWTYPQCTNKSLFYGESLQTSTHDHYVCLTLSGTTSCILCLLVVFASSIVQSNN